MKRINNSVWITLIILFQIALFLEDVRYFWKTLKVRKALLFLVILTSLLFCHLLLTGKNNQASFKPYAIKGATYWTKPTLSLNEVQNLAKYRLVVVDLENKFNNYQSLVALKQLNPDLKLLCYSNPMEIFTMRYNDRPWQNKVIDEIVHHRQAWLLKTITPIKREGFIKYWLAKIFGDPDYQEGYAKFWNGMLMLNMSATCPRINGQTYQEWMSAKLNREILSDPIWDGYFQDNGTGNISWTQPKIIDINGDQKADDDVQVDINWKKGMSDFLNNIRRGHQPNFIIVTNKGSLDFLNTTNGKWFENFPNDYLGDKWAKGWRQCLHNAEKMGNYTIFQGNRANIAFVSASALLLDNVYVAVSQDDSGLFPELEIQTGKPLGKYENRGGIYYREYEKVLVTVDPLKEIGLITRK